ncbi:hypothetical protein [Cellulosimicrobium cellulans]|uniref:hypothetical protein n=1 Tax=Cellulosimicrobium cellulans TaxID=1710 RepID=UPI0008492BB0|nr:hypothetical protein [Cellulosimicrobium cellulans]
MTVQHRPVRGVRAAPRGAVGVAGLLGLLLLTACSGGGGDAADPTPSGTPTSSAPEDAPDETAGTASPDEAYTLQEACTAMYVDGGEPLERRVVAALVDVSEGADTDSVSAMTAVGIELGSLSTKVPDELTEAVAAVRVPFLQLQENLDTAAESSVDLDVASAHDGLTEYRAVCDAAGEDTGEGGEGTAGA